VLLLAGTVASPFASGPTLVRKWASL